MRANDHAVAKAVAAKAIIKRIIRKRSAIKESAATADLLRCASPDWNIRMPFLPRMTSGEAWALIAANNARNRGSRRLYLVLIMAQNPWDAPSSALVESRTALHYDSSAAHLGRERHAMP
jgi:hypothetical protein